MKETDRQIMRNTSAVNSTVNATCPHVQIARAFSQHTERKTGRFYRTKVNQKSPASFISPDPTVDRRTLPTVTQHTRHYNNYPTTPPVIPSPLLTQTVYSNSQRDRPQLTHHALRLEISLCVCEGDQASKRPSTLAKGKQTSRCPASVLMIEQTSVTRGSGNRANPFCVPGLCSFSQAVLTQCSCWKSLSPFL
ncbi:hypothetical protein BaRGS_00014166 [Batillaria attramentaria]|uniref:Uncharacterized protein n=1 Tax=Batillaria attramentaria TaxID=370345 RepID=A0ABD0L4N6_9CAEN